MEEETKAIKKKPIKRKTTATSKKVGDKNPPMTCFKCDVEKPQKDFYMSNSDFYHHMPTCKECLWSLFEEYVSRFDKNIQMAMIKMCTGMDMYYTKNLLDTCITRYKDDNLEVQSIFKLYMQAINSNQQYKGLTFRDSEIYGQFTDVSDIKIDKLTDDVVKWGMGYTDDEYKILNAKFDIWVKDTGYDNIADTSAIRDICKQELALDKDPYDNKALKTKMELIKLAGLDGASRKKEKKEDDTSMELGSIIAMMEKTKPADHFDDQELFKDMQGRDEYYNTNYIRPLRNMVQDTRDFPKVKKNYGK